MKRILSIIMVCMLLTATLTANNVLAVTNNSSKTELINLLQYYCWDFGDTPEYGYELYTKESYDTYYSAKQKAEKLIADENTTEKEFQNMINEFETARENLISVASFIMGDVNLNGNIDVDDVTIIQKHLSGLLIFNDGIKNLADLNKDNVISIDDVTVLQKMIAGI